jgi:hypothetical protein
VSLAKAIMPAAGAITAAWFLAYRLGLSSGSSATERRRVLHGDEVVAAPDIVTDHAVSIGAPPEDVWPWLVQMGWHRGGWYTHRWVDTLLFPQNNPSAETILSQYQALQVGDLIPDGAPQTECYFTVHTLKPAQLLVLHSTSHLPPGLAGRPGVRLNWTWTFALEPEGYRCARLHFRSRITLAPWWLRWAYRLVLVPADHVMAGSMCKGIKQRVEKERRRSAGSAALA